MSKNIPFPDGNESRSSVKREYPVTLEQQRKIQKLKERRK
jgi:hypothetical protein